MGFTPEEISLCKQVVGWYRKEIKYGDWYLTKDKVRNNADSKWVANEFSQVCIPLWTISDCLEFLREKFERLRFRDDKKFEVQIWWSDGFYYHIGKTVLEAYLRAVLAVLEEKKK